MCGIWSAVVSSVVMANKNMEKEHRRFCKNQKMQNKHSPNRADYFLAKILSEEIERKPKEPKLKTYLAKILIFIFNLK